MDLNEARLRLAPSQYSSARKCRDADRTQRAEGFADIIRAEI
jgi:hypothetical protein